MAVLLLLPLLLFSCSAGVPKVNDGQDISDIFEIEDEPLTTILPNATIVGGSNAYLGQIPYQVAVLKYRRLSCGGTVINKCFVLTAGHCVTDDMDKVLPASTFDIVTGIVDFDGDGQEREIEEVIPHEQFYGIDFDIALLKLKKPLKYNALVKSIPLLRGRPVLEGEIGRVSGWGLDSERGSAQKYLQFVDIPLTNLSYCRNVYGSLPENVLCAEQEDKDSCKGDSGGPFAIQGELAGIVSFGIGCGRKGFPGVYTDVSAYTEWIKKKTLLVRCSASFGPAHLNIFNVLIFSALLYFV